MAGMVGEGRRNQWILLMFLFVACSKHPTAAKSDPLAKSSLANSGQGKALDPSQRIPGKTPPDANKGGTGHVVYQVPGGSVQRIAAVEGAVPEDLSAVLDKKSPGKDKAISVSRDGTYLLLSTTRFGCGSWPCLVVLESSISSESLVKPKRGELIHADNTMAIGAGGNQVVYEAGGGPHSRDLYLITRQANQWGMPSLLTKDSKWAYHRLPVFSPDGSKIVMDCGPVPYSGAGTSLCEVSTQGTGFRIAISPTQGPSGKVGKHVHSGGYDSHGGLVFEGDFGGEQIYRQAAGAPQMQVIAPQFRNDNTPCVLPDGRIVSLWVGRSGKHEIKVMTADGSHHFMLLSGIDVVDHQLGCSW
jgi:hypothetical protein